MLLAFPTPVRAATATENSTSQPNSVGTECTPKTPISNATKTVFRYDNAKQELICCVSQCAPGFTANYKTCTCDEVICKEYEKLDENQKNCISRDGDDCTPTDPNAKSGTYTVTTVEGQTSGMCKITDCENGFVPNEDGTACEKSEGDCTEDQLKEIPNATKGQKKKGVCYATECDAGYEVEKGKCVAILNEENKDTPKENNTENKEETDNTPKLSEEDSKKKIAELQENYDAMKEKEQSTENKLLGAGAMASIGAGGQMIASSLAEQQADEAAELDMTAYLATFRCDFGQGRNIKGGETDIVLPGGNALAPLYTEYVQLAQDLKMRKEALGMAPGIESEEILDKANMGLYDNESLGKTDGAFTSLASALSNPTGADAAEWAAQKAETAEQLKTGAITAGVGAVASIAANIAINENKNAKQEEKESGMNDVKENNKSPDSTCLSKLTIKEEVKQTDYYKKIESFCSVQFPNSSDCAKIILAYFDGHSYVTEDLESHVVTEYSLNFYIKEANTACETYKYAYDSHFIKEK